MQIPLITEIKIPILCFSDVHVSKEPDQVKTFTESKSGHLCSYTL